MIIIKSESHGMRDSISMKIVDIHDAKLGDHTKSLKKPRATEFSSARNHSPCVTLLPTSDLPKRTQDSISTSIEVLDTRAPRYTSYPTADRFVEAFGPSEYARHLATRDMNHGLPLSVYLHIPFCSQLCFYCACNKTITRHYDKAIPYVEHLIREMALVDQHLTGDRRLRQIHWGGGTPTFLKAPQIEQLMTALKNTFEFDACGENSIEIDPRTVDRDKLQLLRDVGFNRLSLGVQDFDLQVQTAINRIQPFSLVYQVLSESRELGFQSTNFDLIYGLPKQTVESYRSTVEAVISLRPERLALYNYAHLPSRFKAQRLINNDDMPGSEEKLEIFAMANELLDNAGYEYIGMDHFALPDDELAHAHRTGRLHRNFQGYSTQPDCDLVALGASSISRIGSCYSQNMRGVQDYSDRVANDSFATLRGLELTRDDILRHSVIMAIMCQGEIDKESIQIAHLVNFDAYFERELADLKPLVKLGYVELDGLRLTVTPTGRRKALRLIAGTFDRYLRDKNSRDRFSRVL